MERNSLSATQTGEMLTIPEDILDDLSSRFIINVPEEERKDLIRICFQIELAHWFYLDFYVTDENRLKPCGIREFTRVVFNHIPFLREHAEKADVIFEEWRTYKMAVPTFGAILLDIELDNVLLVQGFWAKASWGFPKGKVNAEEEPHVCAAREVMEETGFDISQLINKEEFLEHTISDQVVRLYIIAGVPKDYKFKPKTRNEIKSVQWFSLTDLPSHKKDMAPKTSLGLAPNNFFTVMPFIRPLRQWIVTKQKKHLQTSIGSRRHRMKSVGETPPGAGTSERPKRQQNFAQMCMMEYENLKGKDNNRTNTKITYSPPPRLQRQKALMNAVEGPSQSRQLHILNKDKATVMHAKRSLVSEFTDSTDFDRKVRIDVSLPFSTAWQDFRFDQRALWAACFGN